MSNENPHLAPRVRSHLRSPWKRRLEAGLLLLLLAAVGVWGWLSYYRSDADCPQGTVVHGAEVTRHLAPTALVETIRVCDGEGCSQDVQLGGAGLGAYRLVVPDESMPSLWPSPVRLELELTGGGLVTVQGSAVARLAPLVEGRQWGGWCLFTEFEPDRSS